ncbi:hypothetical protein HYT18_03525 [Candidatus Microgenomates bacterium]|nr:hypothetical protein [Candidatus Microgenomates bacterium]
MDIKTKLLNKIFVAFSGLLIVFQSIAPNLFLLLTPGVAYAQEETPAPQVEASPSPTDEPTPTAEPSPTLTPAPLPEPSVTPEPTLELSPTPTSEPEVTTTPEPTPSESPIPPPSESPTPSPTVDATPTPDLEQGSLTAVVVENTSAESVEQLDLDPVEATSAQLVTDKADYAPTDTVVISATGLEANTSYTLVISSDGPPALYFETQLTSNEEGEFVYAYQLDGTYRPEYKVELKDSSGQVVASTTFTDPPPVDFKQCANDRSEPAGTCDWIGSILQSSNSVYFEGMSVPQRILYRNVGNGAHTISFKYSYTKGGTHAYDFITSLNQGNGGFSPGITDLNKCQGLSGADLTACTNLDPTNTSPDDEPTIPNDSFDSKDSDPAPGTGTSQTDKEIAYEAASGDRKIQIYTSGTLNSASVDQITHDVGANGDTGDSNAQVAIDVDLSACGVSGCSLLIYFGGHLAKGGSDNTTGVNWGPGLGSSSINGGPYHIKDLNIDGSGGSLDNQIQGADILVPPGSITLDKVTDPSGDPQSFSFSTTNLPSPTSPSLTDSSTPVVWPSLSSGTYTITETVPGGWTLTSKDCTGGSSSTVTQITNGVSISLAAGENLTCTFNNTKKGTIIVEKQTDPDATAGSFTFTGDASGTISDNGQITVGNLIPGTYTSTENDPGPTFDLTTIDCDDDSSTTPSTSNVGTRTATFKLDPGETVKCTFTNTLQEGTLIVKKHVVNDNGGTATAANFNLHVKKDGSDVSTSPDPGSEDGTSYTLVQGDYVVSEDTPPAGYTQTGFSGDCDEGGNVTVVAGVEKTCTITNNDIAPKLTVIKHVVNSHGGTLGASNFTMNVAGTNVSDPSFPGSESGTQVTLDQGAYNVTEDEITGYTTTGTSADCSGSIDVGEEKTCTITNEDTRPILKVIKHVINDDGGTASASEFTINVTANGPEPSSFPGDESGTDVSLDAGAYSVDEDDFPGYAKTIGENCSGTINVGETKSCTITNNDIAPTLKLVKSVTNDNGGNANPDNWTLSAEASSPDDGRNFSNLGGSGIFETVFANAGYDLSESSVDGYTAGSWSCDGGSLIGSTVTLGLDDDVTCTITNNDQQAYITVVKVVNNDHNGSAEPDDFNLTLEEGAVLSGVAVPVNPGTYTAGETLLDGYAFDGFTGDCDSNGDVTVALGESKTCTLTNHDLTGHLIVHKVTDPADDPTVFSITLSDDPVSGSATRDLSTISDVDYEVDAGTYSVSEADKDGWDETGNTCVDVVVANGETEECTITNTQRGHIIIQKNAIPDSSQAFTFNNNFGNGNPATFNLTDDSTPGLPSYDAEVLPGTYAVTEDPVIGWQSPESTSCDQGETVDSIDVGPGETVTCTFTNEELATIILVKNTVGGDDTFDFDATGTGLPADIDLTTSGGTASQTFEDLDPDNTYTIAENIPGGWDLTNAICSGSNTPDSITPNAGEVITCTFTNTARGHIIVDKVTDPSEDPQEFEFNASGGTDPVYVDFSLTDTDTPNDQELKPDSYSVSETLPDGWDAGDVSCVSSIGDTETASSLELDPGEIITCTFNNQKDAFIIVEKQTLPNGSGQEFAFDPSYGSNFNLTDDNQNNSGDLDPGTYSVAEVNIPSGWDLTNTSCTSSKGDAESADSISLQAGETVTCVFTNTQRGHLIVQKTTDPSSDPTVFDIDASGSGIITGGGAGTITDATDKNYEVTPGIYSVTEDPETGWDETGNTCTDVVVDPGETEYCEITNVKQGKITIVKDATPNDAQDFEFSFTDENNFFLDDDAGVQDPPGTDYPQSKTFDNLPANEDYTAWQFQGISCVNDSDQSPYTNIVVEGTSVTITLDPGAEVTCTFDNFKPGPTRTQGFWQTHTSFTSFVFGNILGGSMNIGSLPHRGPITNTPAPGASQLFGAYYSNIAMKSIGKGKNFKRNSTDHARMVLLQQLVTAKLNCAAFVCSSTILSNIAAADSAYFAGLIGLMQLYTGLLDAYNNSGDTIIISPPLPSPGNATPQTSRSYANISFWDIP